LNSPATRIVSATVDSTVPLGTHAKVVTKRRNKVRKRAVKWLAQSSFPRLWGGIYCWVDDQHWLTVENFETLIHQFSQESDNIFLDQMILEEEARIIIESP
jgi:hypothetical protein